MTKKKNITMKTKYILIPLLCALSACSSTEKDTTVPEIIPVGSTSFEAKQTIPVPTDVDPGEYHFMIRLTDRSGWQQLKSVSIRVSE